MQIQNGILTTILFLGYLVLWYIKRRELIKSTGIDVNAISRSTSPIQKYVEILEKVLTVSVTLIILIHAFFKDQMGVTESIDFMDNQKTGFFGFFFGLVGLLICRIAQITIGISWRLGIDKNEKLGLVTNGIYKYVRNPTYTGLYLLCAGVWMINPTFLYSFWALAFFLALEIQVRCEEEYLVIQYGDEYLDYCKRTKRYIPMIY